MHADYPPNPGAPHLCRRTQLLQHLPGLKAPQPQHSTTRLTYQRPSWCVQHLTPCCRALQGAAQWVGTGDAAIPPNNIAGTGGARCQECAGCGCISWWHIASGRVHPTAARHLLCCPCSLMRCTRLPPSCCTCLSSRPRRCCCCGSCCVGPHLLTAVGAQLPFTGGASCHQVGDGGLAQVAAGLLQGWQGQVWHRRQRGAIGSRLQERERAEWWKGKQACRFLEGVEPTGRPCKTAVPGKRARQGGLLRLGCSCLQVCVTG
jgi:hypothetical protein